MSCPRLFHVAVPGFVHSRSFRCIWLLEELDVRNFEICMLVPGKPYANQMREYGVRHSQKIPTLQLDGHEISESAVISQVLAERYENSRSLLGTATERIEALQWVAMAETCITFRIPLIPSLMNAGKSFIKNAVILKKHLVNWITPKKLVLPEWLNLVWGSKKELNPTADAS